MVYTSYRWRDTAFETRLILIGTARSRVSRTLDGAAADIVCANHGGNLPLKIVKAISHGTGRIVQERHP
jgi:hypothetical protein